jgi:bacterioferritin
LSAPCATRGTISRQGQTFGTGQQEFLEHARQEQEQADWIAERINQLGGLSDFNPHSLAARSHSEGTDLASMIREDLVAEWVAIESCSAIIRWLREDDPASRKLLEEILKIEEEHANGMVDLLSRVTPH